MTKDEALVFVGEVFDAADTAMFKFGPAFRAKREAVNAALDAKDEPAMQAALSMPSREPGEIIGLRVVLWRKKPDGGWTHVVGDHGEVPPQ